MKWVTVYFIALFALAQLTGCQTPKVLNWITPDRIGAGVSNGTMNAHGVSNKFLNNQEEPIQMDIDGETYSTSVWLEWDFPQWKDEPNYDEYLRDRVRTLHLEKLLLQKEKDIKDLKVEEEVNISSLEYYRSLGQHRMWPYKLTQQYL